MRPLIQGSLARRSVVVLTLAAFFGIGIFAFTQLNIEAYPDPSPPMVEVITQSPGQSSEEIERYITIPLEVALAGMPGMTNIRSISLYGLSDIKIQFTYQTEYLFAQQQVLNRISQVNLLNNIQPAVSPTSPVGEIFRYQVVAPPGYNLAELKTIEDWILERRFRTIPGVIDVVGWGGLTKEYHVDIDLRRLLAANITLPAVFQALSASNLNIGARTIEVGEQSVNVRGIGLIEKLDDLDRIVLSSSGGTPILLRDVATSSLGYAQRLGIIGRDKDPDIVEGIVLMRRGDRTLEVVRRVEAMTDTINHSGELPPGVQIVPYYDRKELVNLTTSTVLHALLFGIGLIFVIQYLFLGDLRSALIVAATIPVALFFAVLIMVLRGDSANLLSVGAIDFGIIVDSSVILVENVFRRMMSRERHGILHQTTPAELFPNSSSTLAEKFARILASCLEVGQPIFFSTAITIAAFIPLFTMNGVEGQIFAPMAKTYGYALFGALLATFTVTPVLSSFLLPDTTSEKETFLVRWLHHAYPPALDLAFRFRYATLAASLVFLVAIAALVPRIGTEFLPKLEEGNLWIRASLPPTISLAAGQPYVNRMRQLIGDFPVVKTVVTQHGRPDDGTDPAGFYNVEFFAPLLPFDHPLWHGESKFQFVEQLKARLTTDFPGVIFNFSQNIEDNVQEAVSGVKGENSIKLFGNDLSLIEAKAELIKRQLEATPGIAEPGIFYLLGQPNLQIRIDRARAARYGLAVNDINTLVAAAVGGSQASTILEGDRQFPLLLRLAPEYRSSEAAIRQIPVPTPGGANIQLADIATISTTPGASYIYRENNRRYIPIKFSVRGRDLGSAVAEAQSRVSKNVPLPYGLAIEWSGEFGALEEAKARLAWIVPLSLLLILVLLFSLFNNLRDSLMALAGIPFAVSGGLLALILTGQNFSVAAAVGFISLFGVSVMDGILMLSYYNDLRASGLEREPAMKEAAKTRLRPMLMTALSACIGLLPAALSRGIGSQTQRPLATVIVGGMLLAPALILLIVPVFRVVLMGKEK